MEGEQELSIRGGFSVFYHSVDGERNGVKIMLKEKHVNSVVEVQKVSYRIMSLKLEIEGVILNVCRAYTPQPGCQAEDKEEFWNKLE